MRLRVVPVTTALALALALAPDAQAGAESFTIDTTAERSVRFTSEMPLERIVGETDAITARLNCDPFDLAAGCDGWIVVDLARLRTGIELRDQHMRDRHLHTDHYPFARFALTSVHGAPNDLRDLDSAQTVIFDGTLTLHGRTQPVRANGTLNYNARSNTISFSAEFTLRLADYGVPRPEALLAKLAGTLDIFVSATLTPETTTEPPLTTRP